ncbi:MAG TPA: Mrp/NBP35 family ATP-binding protein [Thermomicrobiales bacterium]|nr:Mrp/NBP35 family ATP-binding protein [Thermomicrobiales bacterium]
MERLKLDNVKRVIAVASGKGGVGKSTVAVNLAVGLARRGLRVGLLDADVHGPNVPLMLGVRRREAAKGWQAFVPLASGEGIENPQKMPPLERHGVKIMSIGLLVGEDQTAMLDNVETVGWLVRNLLTLVDWGELDVLLIDFPPGTSEPQATLLKTVVLDGVVLVVTPQDLARLDTTRALRAFQRAGVPVLGVVENMSYLRCPHCGERIEIFHRTTVERPISSEIPLLVEIPLDPALSVAGDTGRPILITDPDAEQSRALWTMVDAVRQRL